MLAETASPRHKVFAEEVRVEDSSENCASMLPVPFDFMAASGEVFSLEPVSVLPSSKWESKVVLAPIRDRFPLVEGREAV